MRIEIQKSVSRHVIQVFRDDGVTLEVRAPDRKFILPHDIVHFVVEKTLGLQRGFWGSVAHGAKLASMTVIEGRQRPHADARSQALIKSNQPYLAEAEVYVGVFQQTLETNTRVYNKVIEKELNERGREIKSADIEYVWSALMAARKKWESLTVGDSLILEWSKHRK